MKARNTFKTQTESPFVFNGKKAMSEAVGKLPRQVEAPWHRVLGVILVEGEMRYLVERGE
jgi:hypothetical protein